MLLLGNRQDEILDRARNRTITALVNISAPNIQSDSLHGLFGMIVEKGKPVTPMDEVHAQSAYMWQTDDECEPLADKDPEILAEVLEELAKRMASLKSPALETLNFESKKIVFNSEDLVERANGYPVRIHVAFNHESGGAAAVAALPFRKLQSHLLDVEDKIRQIGGRVHSADIAHSPRMTAFEYYEMATKKYFEGQKFGYGHVMLARATELLRKVGTPYVEPRKPSSKPH